MRVRIKPGRSFSNETGVAVAVERAVDELSVARCEGVPGAGTSRGGRIVVHPGLGRPIGTISLISTR